MTDKINKKYTYKPLKSLKEEEIVKGILSCDTSILSGEISLMKKNKKGTGDNHYFFDYDNPQLLASRNGRKV